MKIIKIISAWLGILAGMILIGATSFILMTVVIIIFPTSFLFCLAIIGLGISLIEWIGWSINYLNNRHEETKKRAVTVIRMSDEK